MNAPPLESASAKSSFLTSDQKAVSGSTSPT